MKRTILFALTLALVGLLALGAVAFAQGPTPTATPDPHHPTPGTGATITPGTQNNSGGMMGDMMNSVPQNGTMMSGDMTQMMQMMGMMMAGQGMMGGSAMMGGGMMSADEMNQLSNAKPLTLDSAQARIQQYLATLNNADLILSDLEEYTWNFYGMVKEKSTDKAAFQLVVDKYSGNVAPEMGPNMMWNTKYSPITAMMRNMGMTTTSDEVILSVDQAKEKAQAFLKAFLPTTTLAAQADTFYGYYNFDVLRDSKPHGMLSVNAITGAVWYHTWHGEYLGAKEIE